MRIRLLSVIFAALLLMGSTCNPKPTPHPPEDTHRCTPACERLRALGCEEGEPLEDGTTCEAFCVETQESGHALNPTCIMQIDSCDEIEACGEHAR